METYFNLKKEPFALLLLTTFVLLFVLAIRPLSNIDFRDKVMFGISLDNVIWIIPGFLITCWLVYLATRKILYSILATWIHVITTVVSTLLLVTILYLGINPIPLISVRQELVGNLIQLVTLLFISGQFIYLGNIILGLINRNKTI